MYLDFLITISIYYYRFAFAALGYTYICISIYRVTKVKNAYLFNKASTLYPIKI